MNIWWIQRNIRLTDNKTLTAALQEGNGLLPVFILDRKIYENVSTISTKDKFLISALNHFDKALQQLGSN
jgi:deoxyribodipyrimidine photolyase